MKVNSLRLYLRRFHDGEELTFEISEDGEVTLVFFNENGEQVGRVDDSYFS
jgi:uncharacterized surface anchored protein